MKTQSTIEDKLLAELTIDHLEVVNESHRHNVPANSETHFKVTIVSIDFAGRHNVGRHQMIYKLVAEELAGPVHALSLHTYTPDEWQQRDAVAPDSPDCLGGSKADH